jgi:hypothetical protein
MGGLVGVVHLRALPGDPGYVDGGFKGVYDAARRDMDALFEGGLEAVVVENFGSAPFYKGTADDPAPAHQVAAIGVVAQRARERFARVGVNVLRNDAMAALGLAGALGLAFVRVNVHVGAYVTDQGVIEGDAARTMRYRGALGSTAEVWADVLVKHASPLAPLGVEQAAADTYARGGASALIVSGSGTGEPVDVSTLEQVREGAPEAPLYVGSGATPESAKRLRQWCDGAIVGTYLKEGGDVRAPVDVERVRRMVDAWG